MWQFMGSSSLGRSPRRLPFFSNHLMMMPHMTQYFMCQILMQLSDNISVRSPTCPPLSQRYHINLNTQISSRHLSVIPHIFGTRIPSCGRQFRCFSVDGVLVSLGRNGRMPRVWDKTLLSWKVVSSQKCPSQTSLDLSNVFIRSLYQLSPEHKRQISAFVCIIYLDASTPIIPDNEMFKN